MLKWISSYLENRTQYVECKGHKSSKQNVVCGVPQGSILGPLLFLLYINDLSSVSDILSTIMFADDANMFNQHEDLHVLEQIINRELTKVVKWLRANKLTLNIKKTHVMLITKKPIDCVLKIYIENELLDIVCKTTFLGVIIDNNLNFKEHINKVCNKIAKGIGIIKKVKFKLQTHTLISLYYAFVYPYLIYCNTVWGNSAGIYIEQILKLQKRCLRIIYNVGYLDHTRPLFKKSNIIRISDLYKYNVCVFMYKHWKGFLPNSFDKMFTNRCNVKLHMLTTRNSNGYEIIYCRTETHKQSIAYTGPFHFNDVIEKSTINVN